MSNDDDLTDIDDTWEEEGDSEDTPPEASSSSTSDKTVKPADSKDARRRLEALLEQQRIKREIDDNF